MAMMIDRKTVKAGAKVFMAVGSGAVAAKAGGYALRALSTGIDDFARDADALAKGEAPAAWKAAVVDTGGGLVLGAAGLVAVHKLSGGDKKDADGKKIPSIAKQAAPFVVGGVLLASWAPVVAEPVVDGVISVVDKVIGFVKRDTPGGVLDGEIVTDARAHALSRRQAARQLDTTSVVVDMPALDRRYSAPAIVATGNPGGLVATDGGGLSLGGELVSPGGLVATNGRGLSLGGELTRPGGMYASNRPYGPSLGGDLRPRR